MSNPSLIPYLLGGISLVLSLLFGQGLSQYGNPTYPESSSGSVYPTYPGSGSGSPGGNEFNAYHFHVYFFQNNSVSTQEALALRREIQFEINIGYLQDCRLNRVNMGPRGPHPVGSYELCCNSTALSHAVTFFVEKRGDLTIFIHSLTRFELKDHTDSAMFLGPPFRLDLSPLTVDLGLGNEGKCLPIPDLND